MSNVPTSSPWLVTEPVEDLEATTPRPFASVPRLVGAHGGAGVTLLAQLLNARDEGRIEGVTTNSPVLLVSRTHAHGFACVRSILAARRWNISALLLVPDAPGKLPTKLRNEAHIVSGVVTTVAVPWVPAWREGNISEPSKPVAKFMDEIRPFIEGETR